MDAIHQGTFKLAISAVVADRRSKPTMLTLTLVLVTALIERYVSITFIVIRLAAACRQMELVLIMIWNVKAYVLPMMVAETIQHFLWDVEVKIDGGDTAQQPTDCLQGASPSLSQSRSSTRVRIHGYACALPCKKLFGD